jgi:hypothetical protein
MAGVRLSTHQSAMNDFTVWDAETGSQAKLGGKSKGTNIKVYMKHYSTRLWCFAYSHNGAPPQIWKPGDPVPEAFRTSSRFIAHNVEFERALWRYKLIPEFGFPPLPPSESWLCTQAAVRMTALPGALENAADILRLAHRKGDSAVMRRMMQPRDPRTGEDPNKVHWNDDPADFAALCEYCRGDVLCEMALYRWIQRHWDMSKLSSPLSDALARNMASGSTESRSIDLR